MVMAWTGAERTLVLIDGDVIEGLTIGSVEISAHINGLSAIAAPEK